MLDKHQRNPFLEKQILFSGLERLMYPCMKWIRLKSSPVRIRTTVNQIQSSPASAKNESNPVRSIKIRLYMTTQNNVAFFLHACYHDWKCTPFEGTKTCRWYLHIFKLKAHFKIFNSNPIQNPRFLNFSSRRTDPIQSSPSWAGLDYQSSGLIQTISYSDPCV